MRTTVEKISAGAEFALDKRCKSFANNRVDTMPIIAIEECCSAVSFRVWMAIDMQRD